jgi:hypothetical protein
MSTRAHKRPKARRAAPAELGLDVQTARAIRTARALGRTANAYVDACGTSCWGTSQWEAVREARRAVGRGLFRAVGAPHPSSRSSVTTALAKKWAVLEGFAEGAAAREAVLEGQQAFLALRAAAAIDLKTRRYYPLDTWFRALCAREGRAYTPPPGATAELDARQLAALFEERRDALMAAGSRRALERVWDTVRDDGWEPPLSHRLHGYFAERQRVLADPLLRRMAEAASAAALERAWRAVKTAGRERELAADHAAALARLSLVAQAA